ncbi:response regulator [Fulvivirga maritima]|uniref:response regulator n=1 Tax=Fulvivirga maritima TaxID=2904247 RepID=UPI001F3818AE|nr:response regulator [Fulvivirga maritima]UII26260.1 response regulator [Fulvivirga maritima]
MITQEYIEVIYIEDNMADAELAIDSFQEHRMANRIHLLEDGQEALDFLFGDRFKELSALPKLILLDLKLPKVSGLEVLTELKKSPIFREIPVVILTSSNEDNDIRKAYQLGANSYIVKPVNFTKFTDTIKQLGLYWLLLNKPKKC